MFNHTHPYQPFFPDGATKLIVGTLPPPRFTSGALKEGDVDFCYGSISGLLWPVLNRIFDLNLVFETTQKAIDQRKTFLTSRGIGVCDIVHSCERDKIDASDLGMQNIQLRDVVSYLHKYPKIDTLLFTGGNSKNGPEYFFRKHLKEYQLQLEVVTNEVPRIHSFQLKQRKIKTVSLIAPSGAANRSIGSLQSYKDLKSQNPKFNTIDFRVLQYKEFF
ncbi:uracil-DNA glycosylase family protein [Aquimarina sp. 2201CG14-23]|uniref:uracil-DNA glycosylase family protein n=1 Tax=Aquimarina mycalae TaxID=3040073 RepID=UPI002477F585|nr:uracil-DNA glycosylase family protein [Aquimarina sp. 2201CG14-23]MDH7444556.1 uracil-DNA glycosylase family protein [Aquimarina sp. 2201CG14-23]